MNPDKVNNSFTTCPRLHIAVNPIIGFMSIRVFSSTVGLHSISGDDSDLPILSLAGMDLPALRDEELIRAICNAVDEGVAGDLFAEVFRRYESRVRAWCYRFTGDRDHAIDLSQEIFLKAYWNLHTFRLDARFSTWLYAITRNHCLNSRKKRSNEPVEINDAIKERLADDSALEPYAMIERNQSFRLMWELISAALNPVEVRVMTLHYGHEVGLAAITEQLALSNPSGAKAYIVSARRKLHRALQQRTPKVA